MEATQAQTVTQTTSWVDKIKESVQNWINKLDLNSYKLLEISAYFAVGFFLGFFLKRHAKLLVSSLIVLAIVLVICTYFDLFFINWTKVRDLINVNPDDTVGSLIQNCISWLKTNILLVISALVGFLLGYNVG